MLDSGKMELSAKHHITLSSKKRCQFHSRKTAGRKCLMNSAKEESTLETSSCGTHRCGKTHRAAAQEGASSTETSAGSQNWILAKRHRARLSQIPQETHSEPALNWADRPRTGTEWHLVSHRTPTPAKQHTAWRSNFRVSSHDSFFFF